MCWPAAGSCSHISGPAKVASPGKCRVTPEIEAFSRSLIADDQHALTVGAVHVPGSRKRRSTPLDIIKLVEYEQRVITGAAEMAIVSAAFQLAISRALARIMTSAMIGGGGAGAPYRSIARIDPGLNVKVGFPSVDAPFVVPLSSRHNTTRYPAFDRPFCCSFCRSSVLS